MTGIRALFKCDERAAIPGMLVPQKRKIEYPAVIGPPLEISTDWRAVSQTRQRPVFLQSAVLLNDSSKKAR
jgi:hypothetical protein